MPEVLGVDPEHDEALDRYCSYVFCSAGASSLHGMHQEAQKLTIERLALQGGERDLTPGRVEPAQREAGAAGCSPLASRSAPRRLPNASFQTRSPSSAATAPIAKLADGLRAAGHAATMKTGVPTSTWVNSHSTCGISIRMQPWEAE